MSGIEGIEVAAGAPARPVTRTLGVLPRPLTARLLAPRLIPLMLALVTFLVFMPALWNGFVAWDDQVNLYDNPQYRGLTWPQIRWMFSNVTMGHWIPLTWLTFGLDFVWWGMNPFGYHLTSLVVFAANAPALYFVARRLLRSATSFDEGTLTVSAVAATLFFALHPLRAESVAWATERRDVLSGLFFLLTVLLYLKAQDHVGARRRWLLTGSVGVYALALLSKASVMVLPAALIVLDVYPLRRFGGRWRDWMGSQARTVWLEKVPFAVLGAAGAAVTYYAQNVNLFITPLERYPLSARPAMVFYSLWFYLEKTLMPWGLSPLYELPARVRLIDRQFLIPAIAVTALTTMLILLRRRWPAGLAAWIYYAIALGPVIGIVHSGHQLTNDRYSYLPGMGLAVLLGGAVGAVISAAAAGALRPLLAKLVLGLGVIWLGGLAYLSTQQAQVWRDTENLWRYAIEVDPDCAICHGNLGVYFAQQNHYQLAKAEFERVLVLRPDGKKPHLQLGYLYATRGDFPRAVDHFQQYVAGYPNDVEGLNNLGVALVNARRTQEALVHLHRGLRIQPNHAQLHVSLAYAYRDLGDLPRAMSLYRDAVKLKYDMPQAWFGIARVNFESGNRDAAHKAWGLLGQLEPGLAGQLGPLFLETW